MKRHKNLERAIVLGLMLSTGIYGTAFAEDYKSDGVQSNDVNITGDNAIVNGTISFNGKIDIGSSDNLETGKLTIDANSNGMEVAYMEKPKLEIFANDITITAGQNGIVTLPSDSISGAIIIGSEGRKINSLSITAKGQGIDNKTGEVKIYGTENSEIKIHSTNEEGEHVELKSAINNTKYEGKEKSSGIVEINGGEITLSADNGNGIITNAKKTSITSKGTTEINVSNTGIESIKGLTEIKGQDAVINADQYGIRADGTSTDDGFENSSSVVNLNSTTDNIINVKGLYDSNGKLQDNSGDGINVTKYSTNSELTQKEDNSINLTADNNNVLNVVDDGIYVDTGSDKKVTLTAGRTDENGNISTVGNNKITTGNNGIDHRGSETITLSATGANVINAGVSSVLENTVGNGDGNKDGYRDDKNGDGIRTQGNGNVEVTAGTYNDIAVRDTGLYINEDSANSKIDLIANGTNGTFGNIIYAQENGVQIDGKGNAINVIANSAGNSITAEKNAVYNNGTGTIKISAKNPNIEAATLANYNDYNNVLIAGENGVKSDGTGSTIVEADNNNTIAGSTNGILSNAAGIIDVTAGNNNTIGQYTDGTHTSQNGINVSSGTVTVTAGNENNIYGIQNGIYATGENSKVTLNGKITNVGVKNDETETNNTSYGISAEKGANVNVESTNGNTIIDVTSGKAYGINAKNGANVTLTSANNFITATTGEKSGNTATSVLADNGTVNITATAENGINQLVSNNNTALSINNGSKVYLTTVDMQNGQNTIYSDKIGIEAKGMESSADLKASINKIESTTTNAINLFDNATINISGKYNSVLANNEYSTAIYATGNKDEDKYNITLDAKTDITNDIGINKISGGKYGIWNIGASVKLISKTLNHVNGGKIGIFSDDGGKIILDSDGNYIESSERVIHAQKGANVEFNANTNNILKSSEGMGIQAQSKSIVKITSDTASNVINVMKNAIQVQSGATVSLTATQDNTIDSLEGTGISSTGTDTNVSLLAKENIINANAGINAQDGSTVDLTATTQDNVINSSKETGIYAWNSEVNLIANTNNYIESKENSGISSFNGNIFLSTNDGYNIVKGNGYGIYATDYNPTEEQYNNVNLSAVNNEIKANDYAIFTNGEKTTVSLYGQDNKLLAGDVNEQGFGSGHAIQAASASNVNLNALDGDNSVLGVIYAKGDKTKVNLTHKISEQDESKGSNIILSSAHGTEDRTDVVAAVYAQNNGEVNIIAGKDGYNYIATNTTLSDGQTEQTIWAQQGGKINIEGRTFIIAENSNKNTDIEGTNTEEDGKEQAGNSLGIAITAGTGKITDENGNILDAYKDADGSLLDRDEKERSTVKITYEGDENGLNSYIKGDIVSGYGGLINIEKNSTTTGGIDIQGNALAANGGKLNINLGNGGTWIGRADDYGDAGLNGADGEAHQEFYNPAFSNKIVEGGTVNLTMGDNSTWYVNGQSWITSVDTTNAQNATIDLIEANTDRNTTSHALTIYDLKGNANINMSLDGNRDVSDMLYIKNAQGEYNIALADAVTTADMYANGLDGLRFATVGAGSNVKFNAGSYDAGVFNVEYEVGTDAYDESNENDVYNGNSLDTEKPGSDNVDGFFDYDGADPNENEVRTLAEVAEETELDKVQETTNYKLIARKGESLSDAGNTVLNMSKANYSQAVYMDTLNKRLGEARYLEGDEGLWVRMRHDKIDKDSSYEITNNMYELGYDKKYESKDKQGYHRRGVAIDYMDGDTSYDDIAGGGETNRKGIWLYDTWIGNKGHYTDYVAKWGHLENSFDLYTKTRGEKVSGEYNNNVYSLSAEWGYKDPLKNGWYFEPQTQLQYARVTGADYETSQGTQVSVDGIDSLIARAGFRLGKDFGEEKKSTFYVKADILHEFLGDQDISVLDKTTDGKITSIGYDHDGTWYSVGLGFSTMLSDNSYAFLDVEKLFGNDNDNSYQINGGFNWLL